MALSYHTSMPLTLDTSKQFRSINELTDLVHAISSAPLSESEPDWVEWKREADLSDRRWHGLIAKFIAGFANRDPVVAKRWAGGCSYLVIGAEPGNVSGIIPVDNANLSAGISRFVRQTVRWSPQYIQHQGKQVLVITMEPPEHGDQMVAMLKGYQLQDRSASVCREGDVFLRRHGRTDLARQEDYDMLVRRFAAGAQQAIGISVQVLDPVTAVPVSCSSDKIASWYQQLEAEFLKPPGLGPRDGIRTSRLLNFENRSIDEYRRQVESYLGEIVALLPSIARAAALIDRAPSLQLVLVNETEHNYAGTRVEVAIEGDVWAYQSAEEAQPKMPKPPRKWGSAPGLDMPALTSIPTLDFLGPHIDNSGSTSIEFHDVNLRPGGREKLDPIYLGCDAKLAGATLTGNWTATSSSASGVARGEFPIQVSSEIFSLVLSQP